MWSDEAQRFYKRLQFVEGVKERIVVPIGSDDRPPDPFADMTKRRWEVETRKWLERRRACRDRALADAESG